MFDAANTWRLPGGKQARVRRQRQLPLGVTPEANHRAIEKALSASVPGAVADRWLAYLQLFGASTAPALADVTTLLKGTGAVDLPERRAMSHPENFNRDWLRNAAAVGDVVFRVLETEPWPSMRRQRWLRRVQPVRRRRKVLDTLHTELEGHYYSDLKRFSPAIRWRWLGPWILGSYSDKGSRSITSNRTVLRRSDPLVPVGVLVHEYQHDFQWMREEGYAPARLSNRDAVEAFRANRPNYKTGEGYFEQPLEADAFQHTALALLRYLLREADHPAHEVPVDDNLPGLLRAFNRPAGTSSATGWTG